MPPAELGELEAFVDLYGAAAPGLGSRVDHIGGATCLALAAARRSAMFNRALGLGLDRPATEEDVEEIVRFYRELGVEWCAAVAPQEGVGWLGIAATLPEHRRRGSQTALLSARVRAAAAAGCEVLVTETGELLEGKPSSSLPQHRSGRLGARVRAAELRV
jgi:hypothetical protein